MLYEGTSYVYTFSFLGSALIEAPNLLRMRFTKFFLRFVLTACFSGFFSVAAMLPMKNTSSRHSTSSIRWAQPPN